MVGLVAYGTVLNLRAVPRWLYVPVNLLAGTGLVAGAVAGGLTAAEVGLDPSALPSGLLVGGVAAVAAAAAVVGAAVLARWSAALRGLFGDRRAAGLGGRALAYETLVRIPVGTSLFEEVAFRGVLLAAVARDGSDPAAVAVSSVAFGLWHIGPTLAALCANDVAWPPGRRAVVVALAVAVTAAGGVALALLRLGTGSLLAPVLVHWALNAVALVAAVVLRRTGVVGGGALTPAP